MNEEMKFSCNKLVGGISEVGEKAEGFEVGEHVYTRQLVSSA